MIYSKIGNVDNLRPISISSTFMKMAEMPDGQYRFLSPAIWRSSSIRRNTPRRSRMQTGKRWKRLRRVSLRFRSWKENWKEQKNRFLLSRRRLSLRRTRWKNRIMNSAGSLSRSRPLPRTTHGRSRKQDPRQMLFTRWSRRKMRESAR